MCAVVASGFLATKLAPKLPVYVIDIRGILPVWVQGSMQTRLSANISLRNDNLAPIHVHALTFDLFCMDWDGNLSLLGSIQDSQQINAFNHADSSRKHHRRKLAIWKIGPKKDFTKHDYLYTTLNTWNLFKNFLCLLYKLWIHSGTVLLPTAGAIHASSNSVPVTVGLVCDNAVNIFRLQVVGIQCALKGVKPGFAEMHETSLSLRSFALKELRGNETGSVLYKRKQKATTIAR